MEKLLFFSNLYSLTGLSVIVCNMEGIPEADTESFSNYEKLLFLDICKALREKEILC